MTQNITLRTIRNLVDHAEETGYAITLVAIRDILSDPGEDSLEETPSTAPYTARAKVEKIEWDHEKRHGNFFAVAALVAIPADEFAGLDITRPFTITQDKPHE